MRQLPEVLRDLLTVIPASRSDLRGSLSDHLASARYCAPEQVGFWWNEVGRTLNEMVGEPVEDWQKRVQEIFSGAPIEKPAPPPPPPPKYFPPVPKVAPVPYEEFRNFKWAYQLLLALAQRLLIERNAMLEDPHDWPAGQEWDELAASSKAVFLREARLIAGIDSEEFLSGIRSGRYNVEDLYLESGQWRLNSPSEDK